jgi:hypothetical protein
MNQGPTMTEAFRTAAQVRHPRLYHYQRFHPEWLASTLRDQRIYLSDPARLNDPWDCKPTFDPAHVQEPQEIEQFIMWLRSVAKERPEAQIEAAFERRLRLDVAYRNDIIRGFSTSNQFMIGRRRIYCLTPDPFSTLMWSHYGDNHRGVCLEFHLGNPVFLNAWEIKYASQYPAWVPHKMLDHALAMLLTKSDVWVYEREFRVVASPDYPDGHPMKLDGEFLKLPPRSLVGIIVGCRGNYAEVMQIVNQHAPGLPLKCMLLDPSHYRLTIEGQAGTETP